jgi:hypothetical protein
MKPALIPLEQAERERKAADRMNGAADGQTDAADMSVLRTNRKPPVLDLDLFGPFWSRAIKDCAEGAGAPTDYVAGAILAFRHRARSCARMPRRSRRP